jgi:hypothetical protein
MSRSPWLLVAVNDLTPAEAEPIRADKAECSLSTFMNLALSIPFAHISDNSSTMVVCGVMG